ncbi:MAG TPA: helix-turn-helix domain-containing protein [Pseudonocardiaceae bacterium]|nr:helix-turn-helix domain-containing protein [Pseudonocardiaceae bacterium]
MLGGKRVGPILDAAYVCFTRYGVRRTTMDDIAREAGISRAAVYQYVRNKEDAFRRLARRLLEEALASARVAVESPGGLTERLTAALETKLDLTLGLWRDSPAHAAELLGGVFPILLTPVRLPDRLVSCILVRIPVVSSS